MTRVLALAVVPLALLAGLAGPAAADPARGMTMPDLSGASVIGTDAQFAQFDVADQKKATAVTFDVVTELAMKKAFVLGVRVPYSFVDQPGTPVFNPLCCGFTGGNLGFYARVHYGEGAVRAALDGGFSLSTASDQETDSLDGGQTAASTHLTHDPSRYLPDSGTLRLGATARARKGRVFAQGETAMLVVQSTPGFADQDDMLIKLDGAAGVRLFWTVHLVAGVNTTWTAGENGDGDDWLHSVEAGLRFAARRVDVGLRFFYPLDDQLRALNMIGGGLELGVRL